MGQPTVPPTQGPVDPYNCAVNAEYTWSAAKKAWCCRIHHLGCPTNMPTVPPPQPDPYNCADGFSNWQAGWSVAKKAWCCAHHSKGCPGGGGCGTTRAPYDCNAGFSNWQAGWSVAKKAWCCQHPMIATPASRIGKQAGLCPRRRGAASTRARAARLQAVVRRLREDCIELEI